MTLALLLRQNEYKLPEVKRKGLDKKSLQKMRRE